MTKIELLEFLFTWGAQRPLTLVRMTSEVLLAELLHDGLIEGDILHCTFRIAPRGIMHIHDSMQPIRATHKYPTDDGEGSANTLRTPRLPFTFTIPAELTHVCK